MQNFGVTNKEHYGMLWYFLEWSITLSITGTEFHFISGHCIHFLDPFTGSHKREVMDNKLWCDQSNENCHNL